jgi:glyoxylase-like metal-dependent hydrolase (beta-lactamase superfamily II)
MADEETARFLNDVRAFARDQVAPDAAAWDRGTPVSPEVRLRAAKIGLTRVEVPVEAGGLGLGFRAKAEACAIITVVQDTFGKVFNEGTEFQRDGSQFDRLFKDGDAYKIGSLTAFAMHTPGHTPACMTHVIGDSAFVGDTLFMPDGGSARADFPGGDARTLYRSIQRVLSLPSETRLFMCHDYGPNGRDIRWETTVAEQRAHNIHVKDGITEDTFVATREARDKTLAMPRLIIPSLQVNMRAGALPPADGSGKVFLKVPLNTL